MRKSALMILTHPHFIGALSLLLFAILLAAGGIGFASATQAAGLAVAFLVAATPSRENLPQTGAWWQAGCAAAFLLVAGCALVMDPIARLYAAGFVFLALLGIRWLLFGRFSDRRDLFLVCLGVSVALALSPATISRVALHLSSLAVPSKFELHSATDAARSHRATRSYALHNLNPIDVQLAAGNVELNAAMPRLQFTPRRETLFPINRIEYKFLGITVVNLFREQLHTINLSADSDPVTLNKVANGLELTDINGEEQAWLELPDIDMSSISTGTQTRILTLKLLIWLFACAAFWLWQPAPASIRAPPNPYIPVQDKPLFPWSWWIWLVHGVFVGALYLYLFTPFAPDWFKMTFSAVSLGHEENYGVWWSAICLFIASQLFYKLATVGASVRDRWVWAVLAVALLALAYDEMGSLHEMVSKVAGWEMLLPFALLFMAGFGFSIVSLARQPGYRISAVLILLGIMVFAAVASLEFVEHNIKMDKFWQRARLIIEEGSELFAMSLIIIAGLLGLRRMEVENRRLSEIVGNPGGLAYQEYCVLGLFGLQFVLMSLLAVPFAGSFSEGNPAAAFPVLMFYTLFLITIRRGRNTQDYGFWWSLAALFLFTSLCQMHSFTVLLNKLQLGIGIFNGPPETWAITLVPILLLWGYGLLRREIELLMVLPDFLILILTGALAYSDSSHHFTYYLFSGMVAYLCYRVMVRLER